MKRGLSLVTSLMMTASVFGGAVSQAVSYSPVAVVSAAAAAPVIGIGDPANNGTTLVSYGAKKVSIPVRVTSTDLLAMIVKLEVTADATGAKNPTITNISQVYEEILPNDVVSNVRSFTWNNVGLKAPKLDGEVIANVEIELPDDATDDSTYTLEIKSVNASDLDKTKGYGIDEKSSDLTEKIAFGASKSDDYTLAFAEKKSGKWTSADKITVEAGKTVSVGMNVKSAEALGAIVFGMDLTGDAKISGYEAGEYGEVDASENNIKKVIWAIPGKFDGQSFAEETILYTINVDIPADAKPGDVYTLSVASENTSTGDKKAISPVKLPSVDLVVAGEVEEQTIELIIDTVKVPRGTKTAEVPVYAKNGNASAIVAMFEAQEGAKVVGIKEADLPGDLEVNGAGNFAIWNNEYKGTVKDHVFGSDQEKLYILTVELPEGSDVTKYPVVFNESKSSISNADKIEVKPIFTNGAVIIEDEEPAETTPAETTPEPAETTPAETTPEPAETTPAETTEPVEIPEIPVTVTDFDPVKSIEAIDAIFDSEDYAPEFYYEHEEAFDRSGEFSAEIKVPVQVPDAEDATKASTVEVVVKLTQDNFTLPSADEVNPHTVYNEKQFYYTVPIKFAGTTIDASAIDASAAGANAEKVAETVKAYLATVEGTANMPVMIGQLGDFDLNHSADQIDANGVLKMVLYLDAGKALDEVISDTVLADSDAAKTEISAHKNVNITEFALFLGNADLSDKSGNYDIAVNQLDANTILKAILERDAIDGTMNRIPVEAWKKAGTAFKD